MMFAENRRISLRQLQALLLLDFFGTALLFLPAELAAAEGRACWITALIGGLIFTVLSFLTASAAQRMAEGTIVEWCRRCFGCLLGNIILMGLAGKLLFDGALELRIFSEILCRTMLPSTPVWVISLLLLLVAGSFAAQGMECRGRCGEISFFTVFLPLAVILAAVALSADYGRALPLELPLAAGIPAGLSAMSIVFQGALFLYFVFPDLKKPQQAARATVKTALLITAVITVIVLLSLTAYGEEGLSHKLLPALQMMERVSFTGIFLTRQDVLLLWFWMVSVSVFLSGSLFFGSLMGTRMLQQREEKRKQWLGICLILFFVGALLPENMARAHQLRLKLSLWLNGFYFLALPVALLLLTRKKGGQKNG